MTTDQIFIETRAATVLLLVWHGNFKEKNPIDGEYCVDLGGRGDRRGIIYRSSGSSVETGEGSGTEGELYICSYGVVWGLVRAGGQKWNYISAARE